MFARVAVADAIRRQALAVVKDDGRNDGRLSDQRPQAIGVADAVLQARDPRALAAKPLQPRGAGRGVLRLGAEQDPIRRLGLRGIGERRDGNLDRAFSPLDGQFFDAPPDTGDDVISTGCAEQAGDNAADTAEADDGHRFPTGIGFTLRHWVLLLARAR